MNKFEQKIEKMEKNLADLQFFYGYNNYRALDLRKKLAMYKKVAQMSHKEVGEQLAYSAGEVQKFKSGYYGYNISVEEDRKLVRVLTERIKAEKQEQKKNGTIVEDGSSTDDLNNENNIF